MIHNSCMEAKENMTSGVTVITAESPSDYHVAPRTETPGQVTVSPARSRNPTSEGMLGVMEKKKRGRPRKYGPDGSVTKQLSPMPFLASASTFTAKFSGGKRGRGRAIGIANNQQDTVAMGSMGEGAVHTDGAHFTPHVITVNTGEDVTAKIISFCQQGPRAICILSAHGMISNAALRQSDSSGGTLTYEGRFEIINLCGSYTPAEREGTRYRAGGLSVALSSPNGQVVGGCVAGLMVAASPIQIVVGSFLPSNLLEQKPKKHKTQLADFSTAAPAAHKDEAQNGQEQQNSSAVMPNLSTTPLQRENWPSMYNNTIQGLRKSTTDMSISLP